MPESARLRRVAAGFAFTEGPVWLGDHLLFADIPRSRIVRWQWFPEGPEVRTFRAPSDLANGLTLDRERRLLACEGLTRRVTRTERDGSITVVADRYQGRRLNSPNDVVVGPDGAVYFSDPWWANIFANPHGPSVCAEDRELDFTGVFRVDPDGRIDVLADDFEFPNGLAFSPDGRRLYVDDSHRSHIRVFEAGADGSFASARAGSLRTPGAHGRVFATLRAPEPGAPDGMKVDQEGNVYCTGPGGIWVFAPSGATLGRIHLPEEPSNLAWGDADRQTLYITARQSLYRIRLGIPGQPV